MAAINRENSKRESEASSCQNSDNPTKDEEENNTHNTHRREETYQTTTSQASSINSGLFLEFIMSVALPKNFPLLMTLKPYDGIKDPQVHMTIFKLIMLVNGASD